MSTDNIIEYLGNVTSRINKNNYSIQEVEAIAEKYFAIVRELKDSFTLIGTTAEDLEYSTEFKLLNLN